MVFTSSLEVHRGLEPRSGAYKAPASPQMLVDQMAPVLRPCCGFVGLPACRPSFRAAIVQLAVTGWWVSWGSNPVRAVMSGQPVPMGQRPVFIASVFPNYSYPDVYPYLPHTPIRLGLVFCFIVSCWQRGLSKGSTRTKIIPKLTITRTTFHIFQRTLSAKFALDRTRTGDAHPLLGPLYQLSYKGITGPPMP